MTKREFLDKLKKALANDLSGNVIRDNVDYYNDYITEEVRKGRKESEVIEIIENSKYKDVFNIWKNAKNVKVSKEKQKNVYFVHHGAKIRYIDPLVNKKRISSISEEANKEIDKNLSYDMNNYVYLDFNF